MEPSDWLPVTLYPGQKQPGSQTSCPVFVDVFFLVLWKAITKSPWTPAVTELGPADKGNQTRELVCF